MPTKEDIRTSADAESYISDLTASIEKQIKILKTFCAKESWTRADVSRLKSVTEAYDKLIDLEAQIVAAHNDWMDFVEAEEKNILDSNFREEIFNAYLNDMGILVDTTKEKFKSLLETYPDHETVRDYLKDYIKSPLLQERVGNLSSNSGTEYAKNKLPKLKSKLDEKIKFFKEEIEKNSGGKELYENINIQLEMLKDGGKFEKLLSDLDEAGEDESHVEAFEKWRDTSVEELIKLKNIISKSMETKEKSFQTFFKKLSPPTFSGDCLDYVEWKTKWESVVSVCKQPETFELDRIKENIPETARKKLFDVHSLEAAWKILDKLYGDTKLITQKLKNKMKSLKPTRNEPHEIVIELYEEVDYLVKRLEKLKVSNVLNTDSEYLNAVYRHLPQTHQLLWDDWETDDYENEWEAFIGFLNEKYESALKKRTRMESLKEMKTDVMEEKPTIKCFTCGEVGHTSKFCSKKKKEKRENPKVSVGKASISPQESKECPCCKEKHTWQPKGQNKIFPSTRLSTCPKFKDLSLEEKGQFLEKVNGCIRCLSWLHSKDDCNMKIKFAACQEKENGKVCGKLHNSLVHGCDVPYVLAAKANISNLTKLGIDQSETAQMLLQDVPVGGTVARVQWDDGCNKVLITNSFAKRAGLEEIPAEYYMQVVGQEWEKVKGSVYKFRLESNRGKKYEVWGYGIDKISDPVPSTDLSTIRNLFPHVPEEVFIKTEEKPLDILIGVSFFGLHPEGGTGKNKVGNLRALRSEFSTGWVIAGAHPLLPRPVVNFSPLAKLMASQIDMHASLLNVSKVEFLPIEFKDFLKSENLGVEPPKRCNRCKNCKFCSDEGITLSCKEQEELEMINKNVSVENGETRISYPFIKDPFILKNNQAAMLKRAISLEKSLTRRKLREDYNDAFQKHIERGAFGEVTQDEVDSYEGPINFISHHGVLQPQKITTPLRLVSNSSQENNGTCLNDCLPKGPNCLCDLFKLLLKFRTYEVGMIYDLSKAYHTMKTGIREKFLRLMIWRFSESEDWKIYAYQVMAMGDRPAAAALECAKHKCADLGLDIDALASQKIKEDMYVDDGTSGGTKEEVARLVGERGPDGVFNGTIQKILNLGNFKIKDFVWSGRNDEELGALLGNKVLGYLWDAKEDIMAVKLKINLSKRKNKIASQPDISIADIGKLKNIKLTKRNLLGIGASIYDPLGIASPYTIKLKMGMRQLFELEENLGWDDEIPASMVSWWINVMTEAIKVEMLRFKRRTKAKGYTGKPILVGFFDGSLCAYAAAVYVIWKLLDVCNGGAEYDVTLLCAKTKVAPVDGCTVAKIELNGGTLLSRLLKASVNAMIDKPEVVIPAGDSQCVIASLELPTSKFKPFFMNRIAEIKYNLSQIKENFSVSVEDFHFIPGKLNPVDLATRDDGKLEDIGIDSEWQSPRFLKLNRSDWPLSREFLNSKVSVDENEIRKASLVTMMKAEIVPLPMLEKLKSSILELCEYSNSLVTVLRTVAIFFRIASFKNSHVTDFEDCGSLSDVVRNYFKDPSSPTKGNLVDIINTLKEPISQEELDKAEHIILYFSMDNIKEDLEKGNLASLLPFVAKGIVYTRGRIGEKALERILGTDKLPILSSKTRYARLLMIRSHEEDTGIDHRGKDSTLAKSRSRAWIIQGGKLAKSVVNSCWQCRLNLRSLQKQQMALIREEQLEPCPPFTHVCLDYLGPMLMYDEVKKRVSLKCWVLAYVCRNTRAVCLLAVPGYDTDKFLLRHNEFVYRHGNPQTIVSDRGTSLVKAGIVLENDSHPTNWNWKKVVDSNKTTNWIFTEIGCQWRNGLAEAMVKITKKCLKAAIPEDAKLTYSELITLLAQVSYTINCRPIGVSSGNDLNEEIQPITPNMLLIGRSNLDVKAPEYDVDTALPKRTAYVKNLHDKWWKSWIKQVFPNLVPCKKWRSEVRNLQVDDICLLYYPGVMANRYKLARVVDTFPDKAGKVRTVRIAYKKRDKREKPNEIFKGTLVKEKIGVQRLIVIQPKEEQLTG